jgi:hypothetical protein
MLLPELLLVLQQDKSYDTIVRGRANSLEAISGMHWDMEL